MAYEDPLNIRHKVRSIVNCKGLRGISIWSLDFDDFTGDNCEQGRYPLLSAAVDEMGRKTSKDTCNMFVEKKIKLPESKVLRRWWEIDTDDESIEDVEDMFENDASTMLSKVDPGIRSLGFGEMAGQAGQLVDEGSDTNVEDEEILIGEIEHLLG